MKLDAFDQYIHDKYQGYEVTPPAALEQAVMVRLNRAKWARRLGSGVALVALVAAGYWGLAPTSSTTVEAPVEPLVDQPVQHALPAGSISAPEATAEVAPVLEVTLGAQAETAPAQPVAVTPRPVAPEPIKNRVEPAPLHGATAGEPALQQNAGGSELWIISAEVEVKD